MKQDLAEIEIIKDMYQRKAISKTTGVAYNNNSTVRKLVRQGQLVRAGNKIFLSDEGIIVAKGASK